MVHGEAVTPWVCVTASKSRTMCSKRIADAEDTERREVQSAPAVRDQHKRVHPGPTSGQPGVDSQKSTSEATTTSRTSAPTAGIITRADSYLTTDTASPGSRYATPSTGSRVTWGWRAGVAWGDSRHSTPCRGRTCKSSSRAGPCRPSARRARGQRRRGCAARRAGLR